MTGAAPLETPLRAGLVVLAALAGLVLAAGPADAQGFGPASVSGRLAALGGAGVAFGSDDGFAFLSNPAHLGDAEGFSWGRARFPTRYFRDRIDTLTGALVRDSLACDSRADYVTLGVAGIGVSLSGRPFEALGGVRPCPNTFGSRDSIFSGGAWYAPSGQLPDASVRNFGLGFRALHTLRYVGALLGNPLPRWDDRADVSFGWLWHRGPGDARWREWGALLRVNPYHRVVGEVQDGELVEDGPLEALGGVSVDVKVGYSSLPFGTSVQVRSEDQTDPKAYPGNDLRRRGVAVQAASGMPRFLRPPESGELTRWARVLGPTFDFRASVERQEVVQADGPDPNQDLPNTVAMELTALGVLSLRLGDSGAHQVHYGFGLRAHYGDAISMRYDRAWVPTPRTGDVPLLQSRFEDVARHSWSFNLNPYGVMKILLGE